VKRTGKIGKSGLWKFLQLLLDDCAKSSPRSRDLQREKVRIYALAKELNVDIKDLLDLCHRAGFQVKNHMSSLDPEQRDAVELLVRKGGGVAVAAPPKPVVSAIPTIPTPVPVLPSRTVRREVELAKPAASLPSPA